MEHAGPRNVALAGPRRARHEVITPSLAERKKEQKQERLARIREALGSRSIVLIGLMGAGKTAVGRRLANRLDLGFTDADSEIELAAGQTVSEIFAEHGEPYFRQGEARVIARLLQHGPQVLATGGGADMERRHARQHQGSAASRSGSRRICPCCCIACGGATTGPCSPAATPRR